MYNLCGKTWSVPYYYYMLGLLRSLNGPGLFDRFGVLAVVCGRGRPATDGWAYGGGGGAHKHGHDLRIARRIFRFTNMLGHKLAAAVMAAFFNFRLDASEVHHPLVIPDRRAARNTVHVGLRYPRHLGQLLLDAPGTQGREQAAYVNDGGFHRCSSVLPHVLLAKARARRKNAFMVSLLYLLEKVQHFEFSNGFHSGRQLTGLNAERRAFAQSLGEIRVDDVSLILITHDGDLLAMMHSVHQNFERDSPENASCRP